MSRTARDVTPEASIFLSKQTVDENHLITRDQVLRSLARPRVRRTRIHKCLSFQCSESHRVHDIVDGARALKDVGRFFYSHDERPNHFAAAQLLNKFIADVASVEIWEHQNVCAVFNLAERENTLAIRG